MNFGVYHLSGDLSILLLLQNVNQTSAKLILNLLAPKRMRLTVHFKFKLSFVMRGSSSGAAKVWHTMTKKHLVAKMASTWGQYSLAQNLKVLSDLNKRREPLNWSCLCWNFSRGRLVKIETGVHSSCFRLFNYYLASIYTYCIPIAKCNP